MALATQCPHCQTTFRVAHDQLKLRAGLVRCGSCKQIFNGIENLLRPDATEPAQSVQADADESDTAPTAVASSSASAASSASTVPAATAAPHAVDEPGSNEASSASTTVESPAPSALAATVDASGMDPETENTADDPLLRMTLLDWSGTSTPSTETASEDTASPPATSDDFVASIEAQSEQGTTSAIEPTHPEEEPPTPLEIMAGGAREAQELPPEASSNTTPSVRGTDTADSSTAPSDAAEMSAVLEESTAEETEDEPDFVMQARRRQRSRRRVRVLLSLGCVVFLLGAIAQAGYLFRDQIAARFPDARPLLEHLCQSLNCSIDLPADIELISLESSELQALVPNEETFQLNLLLRNRSALPQRWPYIELTLNDSADRPLVRRIFAPREYLPSVQREDGFPSGAEQSVRLRFSLSQAKAAGYRVYLFHP